MRRTRWSIGTGEQLGGDRCGDDGAVAFAARLLALDRFPHELAADDVELLALFELPDPLGDSALAMRAAGGRNLAQLDHLLRESESHLLRGAMPLLGLFDLALLRALVALFA